jgi:RNA polymerase sigma factor (sigma-70 family)
MGPERDAPDEPAIDAAGAEEAALVARAQRGDLVAYEDLVRRYEEVAFRVAYVVLRDAAEAQDAAQEAFVRAYRALDRFRTGEPFRPWLLRIVANQAVSAQRAARRRSALAERFERADPASREPSPEALALDRERRDGVLAGLERLRPDERLVLELRYFLDLGEAEMAATLGCARGTVKSRVHRALARLRPLLVDRFPELAGALDAAGEMPA